MIRRLLAAAALLLAGISTSCVPMPDVTVATAAPLPYHLACPDTPIHCYAEVISGSHPDTPAWPGYGPLEFHEAYQLPCRPRGAVNPFCRQPATFGSQTIAIIDAGTDATIEADLAIYDARYSIPTCTQANGCLTIVNQTGAATPLPPDLGWSTEIAVDVETAHEICQTCKVLLVEANSSDGGDFAAAEDSAASLGATEISNSYGGSDTWANAADYNHPGVAITAASGDDGYASGPSWPATLPTVIGVGGTSLQTGPYGAYASETAWDKGGSGCSEFEAALPWQLAAVNEGLTDCGSMRPDVDIAADGDPLTGAAIVTGGSWVQAGGTSLAAPLIAAMIALAGGMASATNPAHLLYRHLATHFHDITAGSTGVCNGTTICMAGPGYDGPTGLGTPNGVVGLGLMGYCKWWSSALHTCRWWIGTK